MTQVVPKMSWSTGRDEEPSFHRLLHMFRVMRLAIFELCFDV
jgi:hypothetical protein